MHTEKPIERREALNVTVPLISVIVPIYNVERYVRKCLDSLKGQTLREIEVICIDDGSTDGSGRIADEYKSEEFPIFRVIHTENRGLSAARNRGIDESRADWLMFVDSDDWVSEDFCRIPYEAAIEYGADIVVFRNYDTTQKGRVKGSKTTITKLVTTNLETIIDSRDIAAWNKFYNKDLFVDVRYPEGRAFEDIYTTYKVVNKSKEIICCTNRLYFHRRRKGSISRSVTSIEDRYSAIRRQYTDLVEMGYPKEKAEVRILEASLCYCGLAVNTGDYIYLEASNAVSNVKCLPDNFDFKQRLKFIIWKTNVPLYRTLYRMFGSQMK